MRARRPPLAEIDTWALGQALRRGEWPVVAPWLLLLAGFCAVLAGLASFFWLTARGDSADLIGLGVIGVVFLVVLYRRLSGRRAYAAATVAALVLTAALVFALWLLAFRALGENVWLGMLGVIAECGLGLLLGLAGINRLAAAEERGRS